MKKIKPYLPLLILVGLIVIASSVEATSVISGTKRDWPWDAFLKSIAKELTGPLPFTVGIIGIAVACFGLIGGYAHNAAMQKLFVIIIAVSVALSAGTIMEWITADTSYGSASGITIGGK